MKIAVIGAGVAGIVSSYLLDKKYEVTLFEADSRLGGHTSTVEHQEYAIDTGFIVLNDKNYPYFNKFLSELKVPIRNSDMSFSYESRETGFCYAGTDFNGLFAQRSNLLSVKYFKFLYEIKRFCDDALRSLPELSNEITLDDFLKKGSYTKQMQYDYLLPMGAAIWSMPLEQVLDFPAKSFLSFFKNHGLLSLNDRPQWQTVVGGSHSYLKAFQKIFKGKILLNSAVKSVDSELNLRTINNENFKFDKVVFASHADQSLSMLESPTSLEKNLLGAWKYSANKTILHTDKSFLPFNKRAWASWNYIKEGSPDSPVTLTYHMNRLQGLKSTNEFCVTLNPIREISSKDIIKEFIYHHPTYDLKALESQKNLAQLQGNNEKYFCGSYFGYGFHEDAVRSAVQVAKILGADF